MCFFCYCSALDNYVVSFGRLSIFLTRWVRQGISCSFFQRRKILLLVSGEPSPDLVSIQSCSLKSQFWPKAWLIQLFVPFGPRDAPLISFLYLGVSQWAWCSRALPYSQPPKVANFHELHTIHPPPCLSKHSGEHRRDESTSCQICD